MMALFTSGTQSFPSREGRHREIQAVEVIVEVEDFWKSSSRVEVFGPVAVFALVLG